MTGGEILLLGDINIDTVLPVTEFPIPGRDGLAPQISVEVGGAVVNSAFVFNNLAQKVALLGCVGKDVWAEKVKQELEHTNINQEYIRIKPEHSTRAYLYHCHSGWRTNHVLSSRRKHTAGTAGY